MIDFATSPACRRIYFNTLVIEFLPLQKCTPSAGTRAVPNAPRQPPALFLLPHNRKCPKLPMHFLHKPLAHPSPPPAHSDPIAIRIPIASRCTRAAPARENMQHIDSSLRSHRSHPHPLWHGRNRRIQPLTSPSAPPSLLPAIYLPTTPHANPPASRASFSSSSSSAAAQRGSSSPALLCPHRGHALPARGAAGRGRRGRSCLCRSPTERALLRVRGGGGGGRGRPPGAGGGAAA